MACLLRRFNRQHGLSEKREFWVKDLGALPQTPEFTRLGHYRYEKEKRRQAQFDLSTFLVGCCFFDKLFFDAFIKNGFRLALAALLKPIIRGG
jgi:hypothetical protein